MVIVTLRHYVGNEDQVKELEIITDRLSKAKEKNGDLKFRLKVSSPKYDNLSEEIKEDISLLVRRLREHDLSVEEFPGVGIGHSFFKAVFDNFAERNENYKNNQTFFLVDGNQYDISDSRILKAITNIDEHLRLENKVVGLALRDFVTLAQDENDDELRRIEELWHLYVCPRIAGVGDNLSNPQGIDTKNIHPAYRKWGDIVPGLIGFNPNNIFGRALYVINQDINRADLTKYAGDPYTIMLLGILSKGKSNFYSEVVPTTRQIRGSRFNREILTDKAKSLTRTASVGQSYKRAVEDSSFKAELGNYFKKENLEEAEYRVLKGFE